MGSAPDIRDWILGQSGFLKSPHFEGIIRVFDMTLLIRSCRRFSCIVTYRTAYFSNVRTRSCVSSPQKSTGLKSAGNYACFHIGSQTRISRETMNAVQCQLEKHNFVRIHRSAIVNLDRVRRLKPSFPANRDQQAGEPLTTRSPTMIPQHHT